jgi:type IV secretion system protein VirB1
MKTGNRLLCSAATLCCAVSFAIAQSNIRVAHSEVRALAALCAPRVHQDTIEAIIRQESGFHPYSLSINYPKGEARRFGYASGFYQLSRQPKDKEEAERWTWWFLTHGHTVSIGLMQVSSEQAAQLGIKDPIMLFDPCVNIAAGAVVLQDAYRGKNATIDGLADAFRLYNAGPLNDGIAGGYARKVIAGALSTTPSVSPPQWPTVQSHR